MSIDLHLRVNRPRVSSFSVDVVNLRHKRPLFQSGEEDVVEKHLQNYKKIESRSVKKGFRLPAIC